jgi:hypothetical protein
MDMCGVAGNEDPAPAVGVDDAVADPEHRRPPQVARGRRLGRNPVEDRLDVMQLGFATALEAVRDAIRCRGA